jgi:RNA polymerase sigma-70 factor (ECF subfamily)
MVRQKAESTRELQAAVDDTRERFLEAVDEVRPRLHRFCARMSGSPLDGEDLVQETLAQAFYSLSTLKDGARLEPWLFRIAHNKCIDFLRRPDRLRTDGVPLDEEYVGGAAMASADGDVDDVPIDHALVALVTMLPPMERACVLLKDVLDYSLTETAAVVNSTMGGVKAALHRGRGKLRELQPARRPVTRELDADRKKLLNEYIDCFNARDWESLRRLIQADARIEIVGMSETVATTYSSRYSTLPWEWKFSLAHVGDEMAIVHWRRVDGQWIATTAVRLWWRDGKVVRIRDYVHAHYMFDGHREEVPSASSPS